MTLSVESLAEMIRAHARAAGVHPVDISRDVFLAAHRGVVPKSREVVAMWTPAKALACRSLKDERPEPKPEPIAADRADRRVAVGWTPLQPAERSRGPDHINKLLVIPDAHAHPQYSNERFAWLGALIAEEKPDVICCLGDWADMPALSQYDKGKRGFEGRRYIRDVECTRDALALMHAGIKHGPELIMCLGNHEARIDRATSDCAELEGTIGTSDLGYEEHGWRVIPYLASVQVGGFAVSHHFASGVAGRPIGGMTMAASMARLLFTSAIVGHSHTLDWARRTRPDGSRVVTLVPGCYTAEEQGEESWCKATSHLWWRGVAVLEGVYRGDFGALRLISQDSMREKYGRAPQPTTEAKASLPRLWKGRAA